MLINSPIYIAAYAKLLLIYWFKLEMHFFCIINSCFVYYSCFVSWEAQYFHHCLLSCLAMFTYGRVMCPWISTYSFGSTLQINVSLKSCIYANMFRFARNLFRVKYWSMPCSRTKLPSFFWLALVQKYHKFHHATQLILFSLFVWIWSNMFKPENHYVSVFRNSVFS